MKYVCWTVAVAALAGCGGGSESIVGSWDEEAGSGTFVFRDDGTVTIGWLGNTADGRYTQADPGHVTVEWTLNDMPMTATYTVEWEEGNLVMVDSDGDRSAFTRQ